MRSNIVPPGYVRRARRLSEGLLVYGLFDPRTGKCRYVGRSSTGLRRAMNHYRASQQLAQKDPCHDWIRSLLKLGQEPVPVVLEDVPDGPAADERLTAAEMYWIRTMRERGEPLLNMYDGGPGQTGATLTRRWRRRIGEALRGRKQRAKERVAHRAGMLAHAAPVICNEDGNVFVTIEDACDFYGLSQGNVWKCLNGIREHVQGLSFDYVTIPALRDGWLKRRKPRNRRRAP